MVLAISGPRIEGMFLLVTTFGIDLATETLRQDDPAACVMLWRLSLPVMAMRDSLAVQGLGLRGFRVSFGLHRKSFAGGSMAFTVSQARGAPGRYRRSWPAHKAVW